MALFKKNIWLAFYITVIFWSIFTTVAAYYTYQNVYQDITLEQANITKISAKSLQSSFQQYETILNLVAAELTRRGSLDDKNSVYNTLNTAVEMDQTIVAFVIFNVRGEPIVSAPLLPIPDQSSLLNTSQTKDTFKATLKVEGVVLGRTYYSDIIGEIILPFRKTVRDREGKVLFVLSLSISLKEGFDYFINNVQESLVYNTFLYRKMDRYFQLAPFDKIYDKNIYNYQIPLAVIKKSIALPVENKGESYNFIEHGSEIVYHEINLPAKHSITASAYLDRYQLWLITEVEFNVIRQLFLQKVIIILVLYVFSLSIMFILFRSIALNQENKSKALTYQATHDFLTNLYNRFYLEQYFKEFKKNELFSVIFINIDNFKLINESYGHAQGDKILKDVALRLKDIVATDDLLVRISSDEFVIVSNENNRPLIEYFCRKIVQSFGVVFRSDGIEIAISASIAVSSAPQDGATVDIIMRNVDLAMYQAKKTKNCVSFYEHRLLTEYLYNNDVENELKKALEKNEFYLVYQPQLGISNNLKGVEALLRWNNSKLGNIPPDIFIPIAEKSGYMNIIGEFVIRRSLEDVHELKQQTGRQFDLSINVSVKQLQNADFYTVMVALLERFKFDASTVLLEVTESVLIEDIEQVRATIIKLKERDLRISLDDFGTGYSSLTILKNLPIDELKIDKSFVFDMLIDSKTFSMVEGIIAISQKLKIITVAEGIETEEVKKALKNLGCDIYQGYYFSKPLNKEGLKKYLQNYLIG
ncbi:MAG: EAL domain-containing protein [Oceanospirillaceae bacterium]|nr:EAL domain-containing protein [Oceanospirillaceae bacterium]